MYVYIDIYIYIYLFICDIHTVCRQYVNHYSHTKHMQYSYTYICMHTHISMINQDMTIALNQSHLHIETTGLDSTTTITAT